MQFQSARDRVASTQERDDETATIPGSLVASPPRHGRDSFLDMLLDPRVIGRQLSLSRGASCDSRQPLTSAVSNVTALHQRSHAQIKLPSRGVFVR